MSTAVRTHALPKRVLSCCPYVSICTELAWPRVQTPHAAHAVLLQNACDAIGCAQTMFTLSLPCTFMSYVMCVRVGLQGVGKTRRRRPRRGICCTCITTSAWYRRSTAMTELTARATANHSMGRSLPTERWCDESRAMGTFLSSLLPSCCLLCVSLDGAAQR